MLRTKVAYPVYLYREAHRETEEHICHKCFAGENNGYDLERIAATGVRIRIKGMRHTHIADGADPDNPGAPRRRALFLYR
jgi:hypothetical protein